MKDGIGPEFADERATFECDCHTHCIVAASIEEESADVDRGPIIELSFWRSGEGAPSLRWKVGRILRFLRRGSLYEDFVALERKEAAALGRWLLLHSTPQNVHISTFTSTTANASPNVTVADGR